MKNSSIESKFRYNYPGWCCQHCGHPVGYLGRFFEAFLGKMHNCKFNNVMYVQKQSMDEE